MQEEQYGNSGLGRNSLSFPCPNNGHTPVSTPKQPRQRKAKNKFKNEKEIGDLEKSLFKVNLYGRRW